MFFDLWTLFVENIFGGFWLAVFGMMALIFIIMGIFGGMNTKSVINYLFLFFMTMTLSYGYRWLSILVGISLLVWMYVEVKNYFSG